ncbi:MAG: hypothetical protein ABSE22_05850 [Xanthobacteraceae bacterium]|jgi:hypothetical protein
MNETADASTQTEALEPGEQEILVTDVSDEALEAAAVVAAGIPTASIDIVPPNCC